MQFKTIRATEAQIKFAQECLDILYGSRDIDGKEMLLLETKSLGQLNAVFKMIEFVLHDDCGTACCIAGSHSLVHGKDWECSSIAFYLYTRGINITEGREFTLNEDDVFYNFCLLDDWSSSIDNAIARLEFVVKTKEVLVIDDSITSEPDFCLNSETYLDELYMDYVNSRLRELIYAPRFAK